MVPQEVSQVFLRILSHFLPTPRTSLLKYGEEVEEVVRLQQIVDRQVFSRTSEVLLLPLEVQEEAQDRQTQMEALAELVREEM